MYPLGKVGNNVTHDIAFEMELEDEQDFNRKNGRDYRIEHGECEVASFPGRHRNRTPGMGPEQRCVWERTILGVQNPTS